MNEQKTLRDYFAANAKEAADNAAFLNRIACIRIEWEE